MKAGDTLSKISAQHYGDPGLFTRIARANPQVIIDPNLISIGQDLKVPIGAVAPPFIRRKSWARPVRPR